MQRKQFFRRILLRFWMMKNGVAKKKNYGLSEGWFVEPFVLEDGTLTLVGEFRGTISTEKSSYKLSGTILIARFNNNGAVFSRIPKLRVSAGTTYGDSYRIFEFKKQNGFLLQRSCFESATGNGKKDPAVQIIIPIQYLLLQLYMKQAA